MAGPEQPAIAVIAVTVKDAQYDPRLRELVGKMADEGRVMATGWLGFSRAVLPPNADAHQDEDMRRSFYAGAQAIYTAMMIVMDPGSEPTERDLKRMANIDAELQQYVAELIFAAMPTGGSA